MIPAAPASSAAQSAEEELEAGGTPSAPEPSVHGSVSSRASVMQQCELVFHLHKDALRFKMFILITVVFAYLLKLSTCDWKRPPTVFYHDPFEK